MSFTVILSEPGVAGDEPTLIIKNIQVLRAIAANGVLISHLLIVEQKYGHAGPVLPAASHFGAFGVDLFFVISGFIMATIAMDRSWQQFLVDRARRILPPYWFYTTLVLIVSLYAPAVVNSSFAHPPSIWRSYLLIPDTVDPLLAVGWTLIHEMYFYLCFAFMLFLVGLRGFRLPVLLLAWTAIVIILNAVFNHYGVKSPVAAVVAHPLTLEFIFGVGIGMLIQKKTTVYAASALAAGILILIIVLSLPDTAEGLIAERNWSRPILVGVPCALIVYGAVAMEIKGASAAPGWLIALGNASYSTYLSHILVLSALGRLYAIVPDHNIYVEAAFVIICVVAANVAGLVSYRLIERRFGKAAHDSKLARDSFQSVRA